MPIYYDNMALSIREWEIFIAGVAVAGMVTGLLFYGSILVGVAITLMLSALLPRYKKALTDRKKSELLIQFRDMLYSVSSSISAGRTMAQALEESIEFWKGTYEEKDYIMRELKYMTGQIRNGNEKDTAVLENFAERSGLKDIYDFVKVYESCKGTGGNLQQAINRATKIIGDKINLERELKTLMAQKIFESRIVFLAPFAIVILLRLTSPDYLDPMIHTAGGRMITTFALGLMGVALIMMERINNIEV